jgi:glycosyltransferase involved in cell wall biosynthesis
MSVEISVVIPTYNRINKVCRAIESVLRDEFDDFEIIVVDDGSTDGTKQELSNIPDSRIKYIRFEQNRGANAARNAGVRRSRGEYISFLDSDDEFEKGHLDKVHSILESAGQGVIGAYTSFRHVNDKGNTHRYSRANVQSITQERLLRGNAIGGFSCTTFRRRLFDEVGYLDEDLPSCQDLDFFIRALDAGTLIGVDEVLLTYHTSGNRISTDLNRVIEGNKIILNKYHDLLTQKAIGHRYHAMGLAAGSGNRMDVAKKMFRKSIEYDPWNVLNWYHYLFVWFGRNWHDRAINAKVWVKTAIDKAALDVR